ncbi:kinase-like domain-containing protein [Cercophora scortea]|uniref:Kinase-like domain-containing protein n=1 Tax=Cercophora scortea TaxID=314031 RepID=A0AAE0I6V7_9PEZI|nr:kinase-like domain-containing protein [Cercophora scortea]
MPELPPIPVSYLQGHDRAWFREERQELTEYFEFFNKGIIHTWDQAKRRPIYKKMKLPYKGLWRTHHNNPFAQQAPLIGATAMRLFEQQHNAGGNPDRATIPSTPHGKAIEANLESEHNLHLKKVLGWGGLGIASLYEVRDDDGKRVKDVVVKYSLKPNKAITREKQVHAYFARAKHIVSSVTTKADEEREENVTPSKRRRREDDEEPSTPARRQRLGERPPDLIGKLIAPFKNLMKPTPYPPTSQEDSKESKKPENKPQSRTFMVPESSSSASSSFDREKLNKKDEKKQAKPQQPGPPLLPGRKAEMDWWQNEAAAAVAEGPKSVLMLEIMPRGSLDTWVCKMAASKGHFSSKVLWLIFECLFKGIVGMAYPPRYYDDFQRTGGRHGPLVEERLPLVMTDLSPDWIHFDLDTSNVLVGDFNLGGSKDDHGLIPIMKVADLGLAAPMMTVMKVAAVDMWLYRKCGKRGGYYAPEQFHPEWNYIHGLPSMETRFTPTVAGRYSWKTNLYWVGLIMWSLVTLHRPPRAPHPYHSIPFTTYDNTEWKEHWTYGGYMYSERWKHIDAELRRTIAACMSDVPEDRPDMRDLWDLIQRKVHESAGAGEDDEKTRMWARDFFEKPGVPGPMGLTPVVGPVKKTTAGRVIAPMRTPVKAGERNNERLRIKAERRRAAREAAREAAKAEAEAGKDGGKTGEKTGEKGDKTGGKTSAAFDNLNAAVGDLILNFEAENEKKEEELEKEETL